jgi:hypothetical protein
MWDNASTVTFLLDNKTPINIVSSFSLPNSIQFAAMPSNSNNEPLRVPGQNNVVIAVNARSFVPTVIDSQGGIMHFALNVGYTMNFGLVASKRTRIRVPWIFNVIYDNFSKGWHIQLHLSVTSLHGWNSCNKVVIVFHHVLYLLFLVL